jgi:hypothetical protein
LVVATREFACVASCLKPCTTHHEKEDRWQAGLHHIFQGL